MTKEKQLAVTAIENKKDTITHLADAIWGYAELSLQEEKSAAFYIDLLKQEGFQVEEGTGGIATAFRATYGQGRPVIGFLAEYDALAGLSQEAGAADERACQTGGNGHGCGHNLLGAGAFGAALGVKAYLEQTGHEGTVMLYGCPGEEGGAAKAFMARDGIFKSLDCALSWHPEDTNEVRTGSTNACIQVQYKFTGTASHASGAPEKGRSALDGVELMNIGVQFLREHMSDDARVHYAITDAGGISPNVVQPRASVLYMIRSKRVAEAIALKARVDKIAQGAALMTETTVEEKFIDGLSETVTNHTLERVLYKNFEALGVPAYTKGELDFARQLSKTYMGSDGIYGLGAANDPILRGQVEELRRLSGHAMNDYLAPYYDGPAFDAGSTDVGDVSWLTPTAQIHVAAWPNGCPGHSWQNVASAGSSIGHKAALHAAKVLAASAVEFCEDPAILSAARREFEERTREGFTSPIPADALPVVPDL